MDEKYLQDLYALIKGNDPSYEGRYSYDQFKAKIQEKDYATKMHTWLSSKDEATNKKPVGQFVNDVRIAKPVQKKKFSLDSELPQQKEAVPTGLSSAGGSSATQPTNNRKNIDKEFLASFSEGNTNIKKSAKDKLSVSLEELKESTTTVKLNEAKLKEKKQKFEKEFLATGSVEIDKNKSKYLNERLATITPKLINQTEEYVVPELNYQFKELGFTFEETGIGDSMIVTAPDGKTKKEISLDPFFNSKAVAQSNVLKQFIKTNTPSKGLYVIERAYTDDNKKLNTRKDVDSSISKIAKESTVLNTELKGFLSSKKELDLLDPLSQEYIDGKTLLEAQRVDLVNKQENIKYREVLLEKSIGKYTAYKAEQGSWVGAIGNALADGFAGITAGLSDVLIDVGTEIAPNEMAMTEENLKASAIIISKKLRISPPLESQSYAQWKSSLSEDLQDNIEDETDDFIKKSFKKDVIPDIRRGNREVFGSSATTVEFGQLKEQGFWGGAILGVTKSLPAVIGGVGPAGWAQRTAQMYAQISDGVRQEMDTNPEMDNISENEKLGVILPIGITGAVLENFGLRNIKGSSGLINRITVSALGKSSARTAGKTFAEIVENEVESKIAKGLLTLGSAGLAEAETGALQEFSAIGIKEIYNTIKGKEMFETPDTAIEWINDIVLAGAQEAVGAFILGVPSSVGAAYSKKGFLKMDDATVEAFSAMANDETMQNSFVAALKLKITDGVLTVGEAKKQLNDYRKSVGLFRELPEGLNSNQKKQALNLLQEKRDLESFIEGKEPKLVVKQKERIDSINSELTLISEVQEDANISETLTEEQSVRKAELEEAISQPENTDGTITIGETTLSREDAVAELQVINAEQINAIVTVAETLTEEQSVRKAELEEAIAQPENTDGTITIGETTLSREDAVAELQALSAEQVSPTKQKNPALQDVESTVKKLREIGESTGEIVFASLIPDKQFSELYTGENGLNDIISEAYHADKAAGIETDITRAVESLFDKQIENEIEALRAAEQLELREAFPNFEEYLVDEKVDESKITNVEDKAKFDEIYEKYDKLITPLLETIQTENTQPITNTQNETTKQLRPEGTRDGGRRDKSRGATPLEGAPSVQGVNGPDTQLVAVAEAYAKANGIELKRQGEYVEVDEARAKKIAEAYIQMEDNAQDPTVKEAYQNLIKQTMAQYQALVDAGYKFWFMDLNIPSNLEYASSPYNASRDLRANKQMGVFPTTSGFGTSELDVSSNPLLEFTGIMWPLGGLDGEMRPVLANDLFRAVHDAFGHGLEGAGFRARGEENAWQAHVRLYTGSAIAAMTSETRGQNSWVNFGPFGEANRNANADDTVFADQKTGLMPEATWTEGRADDMQDDGDSNIQEEVSSKTQATIPSAPPAPLVAPPAPLVAPPAPLVAPPAPSVAPPAPSVAPPAPSVAPSKTQGLSEAELPGFDRMIVEVDGIVKKSKSRRVSAQKMVDNVMSYVMGSKVYENATDVQREALVRKIRKDFGLKEKSAPSVGRILGTIKNVTKITMTEKTALKKQIKDLARGAKDAVRAFRLASNQLSKEIKELKKTGKITSTQAANVLRAFSKVNVFSETSVQRFTDYMTKVFKNADYASNVDIAKKTRASIKKLSKNDKKNANLRDLGAAFTEINPLLVEDIEAYNKMAQEIKTAIQGSSIKNPKVAFADTVNIKDANKYVSAEIKRQEKILKDEKIAEIESLYGINASSFSEAEMTALLTKDEPMSEKNDEIVKEAIKEAFEVYKKRILFAIENGFDPMTGDDVKYSASEKNVILQFLEMDTDKMSSKVSIGAVDSLLNFLVNNSTAGMSAVYFSYMGEINAQEVAADGISAITLKKYFSEGVGRVLAEQTTNLSLVFEKLFKGFTRGGDVQDSMGLTKLINKKAFAENNANSIIKDYVSRFYKNNIKPNGQKFNTAYNDTEREMSSFMMRNIIGDVEQMQAEFNRRKGLIEQSIEALAKGDAQEVEKGLLYQKLYAKILVNSTNIQDIKDNTDPINLEAIDAWSKIWESKFDRLADVALNVYNKVLKKGVNYSSPDKYTRMRSAPKEVDLLETESAFIFNTNGVLYNKNTGRLEAVTETANLPQNSNKKVLSYIDLSFDKNNASALYDALVDIETAGPLRQVQAFLNSNSFSKIIPNTADANLLKGRIELYIRNIRNKSPYSNDELSNFMRGLNKVATLGVGQALAGVTQPIKQVIPAAVNTLINAGSLNLGKAYDPAFNIWLNNLGYGISNRGVESTADIDSINSLIEQAADSKLGEAMKLIENANKKMLQLLLVNPDVAIARASWAAYYEQSLKKQGIDVKGLNYSTHIPNEKAANYAQRMVDRQQNVSDMALSGALFSSRETGKEAIVKLLMPFASFRMNQSSRVGADLSTLGYWNVSTREDKVIAARSLAGFAAEVFTFRTISAGISISMGYVVLEVMGRTESEEEEEKRINNIIKGQVTGGVIDFFSPVPMLDMFVQTGASGLLNTVNDAMGVSEEERLSIYGTRKQDFVKNLGMYGIALDRASQLHDLISLSVTGVYEDDFGNEKQISEDDQEALQLLIGPAIITNLGLGTAEFAGLVRGAVKTAKKKPVDYDEAARKEEKAEQSEIDDNRDIEILREMMENTRDSDVEAIIQQRIDRIDSETPEEKEERLEKSSEIKEQKLQLLGEYQNETEMKRYDRASWEESFGENSDWFNTFNEEKLILRELESKKQDFRDEDFDYSADKKTKKIGGQRVFKRKTFAGPSNFNKDK